MIGQVLHATFGFIGATLLLLAMARDRALALHRRVVDRDDGGLGRAGEWAWFKTIELVAAAR